MPRRAHPAVQHLIREPGRHQRQLFFFTISGARAWPEATLREWAEAAGFRYEGLTRLMTAPNVLLRFRR